MGDINDNTMTREEAYKLIDAYEMKHVADAIERLERQVMIEQTKVTRMYMDNKPVQTGAIEAFTRVLTLIDLMKKGQV